MNCVMMTGLIFTKPNLSCFKIALIEPMKLCIGSIYPNRPIWIGCRDMKKSSREDMLAPKSVIILNGVHKWITAFGLCLSNISNTFGNKL